MKCKNPVNFNYGNLRRWLYLNLPKYQPLTDTKIEELTRNALLFFNIPPKTGTKPIRFVIKYFALKYVFKHTNKHWWRDFMLIAHAPLREVLEEADRTTRLWWETIDYESYYGGFI